MTEFKVGDRVRLMGAGWGEVRDGDLDGAVVTIERVVGEGWGIFTDHEGTFWYVYPLDRNSDWFGELVNDDKSYAESVSLDPFPSLVRQATGKIADMLIEKNSAYGNSALDPVRVFSKASTEEQLLVRIDDKISRIQRGHDFADEDTIDDLIGYLFLLKIARRS